MSDYTDTITFPFQLICLGVTKEHIPFISKKTIYSHAEAKLWLPHDAILFINE
jgi:hypothetical protein